MNIPDSAAWCCCCGGCSWLLFLMGAGWELVWKVVVAKVSGQADFWSSVATLPTATARRKRRATSKHLLAFASHCRSVDRRPRQGMTVYGIILPFARGCRVGV